MPPLLLPAHQQHAPSPVPSHPTLSLHQHHRCSPYQHPPPHSPPPPSSTTLRRRTPRRSRAPRRRSALSPRARAVRVGSLACIRHRLDARAVRAAARLRCGGERHVGALSSPSTIRISQSACNTTVSAISRPRWELGNARCTTPRPHPHS